MARTAEPADTPASINVRALSERSQPSWSTRGQHSGDIIIIIILLFYFVLERGCIIQFYANSVCVQLKGITFYKYISWNRVWNAIFNTTVREMAFELAVTKLRFSLPYRSARTTDLAMLEPAI